MALVVVVSAPDLDMWMTLNQARFLWYMRGWREGTSGQPARDLPEDLPRAYVAEYQSGHSSGRSAHRTIMNQTALRLRVKPLEIDHSSQPPETLLPK